MKEEIKGLIEQVTSMKVNEGTDVLLAELEDIYKGVEDLQNALAKCVQTIEVLPKDDIGGGIAALVKYSKRLIEGVK